MSDVEPGPDRNLAFVAWLLAITSVWLPWWVVSYKDETGRVYDRLAVHLFEGTAAAYQAATILTGLLAVAAMVLLFVRLAGRSWAHEPASWRRDLRTATGLGGLAWISALAWPREVPAFWGGRTFSLDDAPGAFTETALPGLGWWLQWLAVVLLALAVWFDRRRSKDNGK